MAVPCKVFYWYKPEAHGRPTCDCIQCREAYIGYLLKRQDSLCNERRIYSEALTTVCRRLSEQGEFLPTEAVTVYTIARTAIAEGKDANPQEDKITI